jgi:hypothetical protein
MGTSKAASFDPATPPDSLTAMNEKLDLVLSVCQQVYNEVLIVKAQQSLPVRTRVAVTFAGAAGGGFLAMLVLRALGH